MLTRSELPIDPKPRPVLAGYFFRWLTFSAIIVTVVAAAPNPDAFRPPYFGTNKQEYLYASVQTNRVSIPVHG